MTATMMSSSSCITPNEALPMVIGMAVFLFGATLTLATTHSAHPLNQLGERPHGTGLWTWLFHYLRNGNVGVTGYDTNLGALSPPLRLSMHGCGILGGWSLFLILSWPWMTLLASTKLLPSDVPPLTCVNGMDLTIWQSGIMAGVLYAFLCWRLSQLPGVSVPGGPRPKKIQRQPVWNNKVQKLDATVLSPNSPWKCLVAEASHDDTLAKFQSKLLTGEPAGRQLWTSAAPAAASSSSSSDAEELIQTMARGGRPSFGHFNPSENPNSCDQLFRAQQIRSYLSQGGNLPTGAGIDKKNDNTTKKKPTTKEATRLATHFYSMLQTEDGHWAGDYGGPHFLMPGLVTAWYVMGKPEQCFNANQIQLVLHCILVHQQSDGGWGTHIESPSTMFGSTLMYVALRLLGLDKEHPACIQGRKFLKDNGGALYAASWSKFYLCLLGLMDWKGHNSVPCEMWLLPNWFPFHPGRMWCHARMVYLPMGYLYGCRFVYDQAETDPLIQSLRHELYCEAYDSIPWTKTRHWVADMDNYSPIPWFMKTLQNILACYENWAVFQPFKTYVRKLGLAFSMDYMHAEDLQTNYIDIGPVNKVLNMISTFHHTGQDVQDARVVQHLMRIQDYLWVAEDGMKMQGYNGSQCWDTSFCVQAMYEADLLDEFPQVSRKAWSYFERTQILSTEMSQSTAAFQFEGPAYRDKYYRHVSKGGWPFSTSAHGWPISDCTAEGLKATLSLLRCNAVQTGLKEQCLKAIAPERLYDAVNVLLTYQNEDGGWATYENNRGFGWYEQLNPSEAFGDIMIDYSYVECSMAVLTALVDFREMYPDHRVDDIQHSIDKGRAFLKSIQREDGSWYGSWACCFCYGMWFGIEGLVKCGEPVDSACIQQACDFVLKNQRPNGGWGEDFTSCYDKEYAADGMKVYGDDGSGVVNTAWALLALSAAECRDVEAIKKGVQYLIRRQLPCGDWPQEGISGVFNRSVGITYTSYRNVFPIWAMGRCSAVYGDVLDD